jgi:hypothetical protein
VKQSGELFPAPHSGLSTVTTASPPKLLTVITSCDPVDVASAGISIRPWKLASSG